MPLNMNSSKCDQVHVDCRCAEPLKSQWGEDRTTGLEGGTGAALGAGDHFVEWKLRES